MSQKPFDSIVLKNLSYAYPGGSTVINRINLTIRAGEFVVIMGPNGSGKSTLLKLILGLLLPHQGSIEIKGSQPHIKTLPGYVPQRSHSFNPGFPANVEEIVGLQLPPTPTKKVIIHDTLNRVGIYNKRHSLLGALSGGQLQRVFIARALISNPYILFLDEPLNNLDQVAQDEFISLLSSLNKENLTIVMISHDISSLLNPASRFIRLFNGQTSDITDTVKKEMNHLGNTAV